MRFLLLEGEKSVTNCQSSPWVRIAWGQLEGVAFVPALLREVSGAGKGGRGLCWGKKGWEKSGGGVLVLVRDPDLIQSVGDGVEEPRGSVGGVVPITPCLGLFRVGSGSATPSSPRGAPG